MRSIQTGMSLIEVMLAQTLGLFLIFGLIQIYLSVQKTFDLQQAIINLQENGRFASYLLSKNIRMAGFAGCESLIKWGDENLAIHGYDKDVPEFLREVIKKGTDSVEIAECTIRDKATRFERFAFFVGATDRKDPLGNLLYGLYVKYRKNGNKRELVSGVEDMQIRYGVVNQKDDSYITDYVTAAQVADWKKVRAIEIALLLRSELPVLRQPVPYEFLDKKLPASRFLHRQWYVYIALRELVL